MAKILVIPSEVQLICTTHLTCKEGHEITFCSLTLTYKCFTFQKDK